MKRKLFCIWMCIALIVTLIPSMAFAKESVANIGERTNMELLDAILQERPWVLETLLDGDISNNPYAMIQTASQSKETLLMQYTLNNCREHAGFAAVLSALEVYANSGEYVSDAGNNMIDFIKSYYGLDSNDAAMETIDDIVTSVDELKYESIFNELIKSNYTASWGETLLEEDSNLENLRQRSKVLKKVKAYQAALKDFIGLSEGSESTIIIDKTIPDYGEYEVTIEKYTEHMLSAYEEDLKGYLGNTTEILSRDAKLQEKIQSIAFLSSITAFECLTAKSDTPSEMEEIFKDYMFDETMKVLNGTGKLLELGSYQMEYAIMLESLASQTESLVETFQYIAQQTDDVDLQTVLNRYAKIAREAGNSKIINYEGMTSYLRSQNTVTNYIKERVTKALMSTLDDYFSSIIKSGQTVYMPSLGECISNLGLAADLGVWVGNKVTGLKDTAKKIFICVYIQNIAREVAQICENDLEQYRKNPNEEAAKTIINELELLKKIRLYGEQNAYDSVKYQLESWIGTLVSDNSIYEQWKQYYQSGIDILMGCSTSPIGGKALTLINGDTLTIQSQTIDTKPLIYGEVTGSDKKYRIAEIDTRLMGGVCLNDAKITFSRTATTHEMKEIFDNLYIPFITANGTSQINVYGGAANFGEVINNGKLTFNVGTENASFFVSNKLTNKSDLEILSSNERTDGLLCYDFENQGTVLWSSIFVTLRPNFCHGVYATP